MNQAALPMITSSPLSIWFTFSIEIFYQYALYGLFVSFACTYVNLQNIQMFTGIYIYVRVCVCMCSRVRKAPYQALLQSFVGGASRTLFLIIYDLQSLPSNQMAIASQMAADPANFVSTSSLILQCGGQLCTTTRWTLWNQPLVHHVLAAAKECVKSVVFCKKRLGQVLHQHFYSCTNLEEQCKWM